jgi:hypothetical protein
VRVTAHAPVSGILPRAPSFCPRKFTRSGLTCSTWSCCLEPALLDPWLAACGPPMAFSWRALYGRSQAAASSGDGRAAGGDSA